MKAVPVRFGWLGGHSPGSGRFRAPVLDCLPKVPLASCLCVTENRHAFIPWLLWNYDRQDWPQRELVVVDSSDPPILLPERKDVRIVRVPVGTPLGKKRNIALEAARGHVLAWFDDDDWQHPRRLSILIPLLREHAGSMGASFAGPNHGFFMDIQAERAEGYRLSQYAIFNGSVYYKDMVRHARFSEELTRSEDTRWISSLLRDRQGAAIVGGPPLFMWLSHAANVTNRTELRRLNMNAQDVIRIVGSAWGETPRQLAALRSRLATQPATRPVRDLLADAARVRSAGRRIWMSPPKPSVPGARPPTSHAPAPRPHLTSTGTKVALYVLAGGARPSAPDPRFFLLAPECGRQGLSSALAAVAFRCSKERASSDYVGVLMPAAGYTPRFDDCVAALECEADRSLAFAVTEGPRQRAPQSLDSVLAGYPGGIDVARHVLVRRLGLPERLLSQETLFPRIGWIARHGVFVSIVRDWLIPARTALENRYDNELRGIVASSGASERRSSFAQTPLFREILDALPALWMSHRGQAVRPLWTDTAARTIAS